MLCCTTYTPVFQDAVEAKDEEEEKDVLKSEESKKGKQSSSG